ncbi:2-phosphosulfolactate phosphatase [Thalassobacillus sp. B23F22_16]|uniref:2-phosphosulfolactate phosphatase n=1 Tax=Thalassobacillus sp. B23F22_16 TaxID=3459513 RepID=UPI00373EAC2C
MGELKFEVAFMPKDIKANTSQICVLVDVLRATTAMVTMLDKGCSEIMLTDDETRARESLSKSEADQTLVCAEDSYGNVSKHAHFSPSLISINETDVKGKRVLLKTTNGTLAGIKLWNSGIQQVLVGSLRNAEAVMDKAVKMAAELDSSVTIVCAGRENGQIAALDDTYTAGVLLEYGKKAAESINLVPNLKDSAKISKHLLTTYPNTIAAFEDSGSGETMRNIKCQEDINLCAAQNSSTLAPLLSFTVEGNLVVKNINEVIVK